MSVTTVSGCPTQTLLLRQSLLLSFRILHALQHKSNNVQAIHSIFWIFAACHGSVSVSYNISKVITGMHGANCVFRFCWNKRSNVSFSSIGSRLLALGSCSNVKRPVADLSVSVRLCGRPQRCIDVKHVILMCSGAWRAVDALVHRLTSTKSAWWRRSYDGRTNCSATAEEAVRRSSVSRWRRPAAATTPCWRRRRPTVTGPSGRGPCRRCFTTTTTRRSRCRCTTADRTTWPATHRPTCVIIIISNSSSSRIRCPRHRRRRINIVVRQSSTAASRLRSTTPGNWAVRRPPGPRRPSPPTRVTTPLSGAIRPAPIRRPTARTVTQRRSAPPAGACRESAAAAAGFSGRWAGPRSRFSRTCCRRPTRRTAAGGVCRHRRRRRRRRCWCGRCRDAASAATARRPGRAAAPSSCTSTTRSRWTVQVTSAGITCHVGFNIIITSSSSIRISQPARTSGWWSSAARPKPCRQVCIILLRTIVILQLLFYSLGKALKYLKHSLISLRWFGASLSPSFS